MSSVSPGLICMKPDHGKRITRQLQAVGSPHRL